MIPSGTEAVIFDLDGLIVDTERLGIEASRQLLGRYGVSLTEEDERGFYGVQDLDYYGAIAERYALGEEPEALLEQHNRIYDRELGNVRSTLPGVEAAVAACRENYLLALCSGSYRDQIVTLLQNLDLPRFDIIVSAEDTERHKPHPDPYLLAARRLGVPPRNCVVFEDSDAGVQSAKAAGMYCIGVCVGNHGTQVLSEADYVVETLESVDNF